MFNSRSGLETATECTPCQNNVIAVHVVSMEISEGTDVDVEQNFVQVGDIESVRLPDDDPVQ